MSAIKRGMAICGVLLAFCPILVHAFPIAIPNGTSLTVNFDYTSPTAISPPPTYAEVITALAFFPPFTNDEITVDIFGGLNGNDLIRSVATFASFLNLEILLDPGVLDGVFSLGLNAVSGTVPAQGCRESSSDSSARPARAPSTLRSKS